MCFICMQNAFNMVKKAWVVTVAILHANSKNNFLDRPCLYIF